MDINPGFPQFSSGGADEDYHTLPQSPKSTVLDKSDEKLSFVADVAALDSLNGFECNICLDFARDPIVTLCGHLYCWPCIYKWLHSHSNSQHCPVCKATLSQTTLVPLYGRDQNSPNPKHGGEGAHPNLDIPSRPPSAYSRAHILTTPTTTTLSQLPSPHPHTHHHSYDNNLSTSPPGSATHVIHPMSGSFRGLAIATLPWLLGNPDVGLYYPGSFYLMGGGSSPVIRHHEQQAKRLLSGVLTFVSCFALLCFLVF